jgi:RNase P subunit RPR2
MIRVCRECYENLIPGREISKLPHGTAVVVRCTHCRAENKFNVCNPRDRKRSIVGRCIAWLLGQR